MGVTPSWHYAGADDNQYNTSAVDIEKPDHTRFPDFKALGPIPYECVLGPGGGLYIPKKWWHHVRSLEMSVSTNVWWRFKLRRERRGDQIRPYRTNAVS